MERGPGRLALSACVMFCLAGVATADTPAAALYGISPDGTLYQVNTLTGQASGPLGTSLGSAVGIALRDSQSFYALTNSISSSHPAWLFALDSNGVATPIGPTGLPSLVEGDITRDPISGTLYGAYDALDNGRRLFTLNTNTGAATFLPGTPGGDISAMAFDARGNLYALDTALSRLWTVDRATGGPMAYVSLSHPLGSTAGMSFDPFSGRLYVADGGSGGGTLYTVDPATGALTTIGPTGASGGLAGLAFVPEPATLLMTIFAAAAAFRRRA